MADSTFMDAQLMRRTVKQAALVQAAATIFAQSRDTCGPAGLTYEEAVNMAELLWAAAGRYA